MEGLLIPGSGGLRVKMTQYADDTSLLLCKDSCLTRSLAIFGDFTRASGAVLNHAKSSVKFFGRWRGRTDVPGGLSLCEGALRILGVHFETSGSATLNWNMRIAVVQRKLAMWKARYVFYGQSPGPKGGCVAVSFVFGIHLPIAGLSEEASSEACVSVYVEWQVRVGRQGTHDLSHRGGR